MSHARRRCALLPLCHTCIKHNATSCGARRLLLFLLPLTAALACMPLSARLDATSYNASLFGLRYNFTHPLIHQLYEIRYLPLAALFLFLTSFLILLFEKRAPFLLARIPFAAGMGALLYSLLMLALYTMYRDNLVWFLFWEEGTELLLIVAIGAVLWTFQHAFLPGGIALSQPRQ